MVIAFFEGCGGPERHQMLTVIWLLKIFNLAYFCCSQFTTLLNKCKLQSSTFSTGNQLIQVAIVSLQVKLVTRLYFLAGFPKFSLFDLCCTGAFGASGAFPSVVLLVHSGSAIWLSSLFSEKFSESGRSYVGSGGGRPLGAECS